MGGQKDYQQRDELNRYIIAEYRRGRTVKSIEKDLVHITISAEGEALPKGYAQQVVYEHVMRAGFAK